MLKMEIVAELCVCAVLLIVTEHLMRKKERINKCTKKRKKVGYMRKRADYSMDMLVLLRRSKKEKGNQNMQSTRETLSDILYKDLISTMAFWSV